MNEAVKQVYDAWVVKGPAPLYHELWKSTLRREWPSLGAALDNLARSYSEVRPCIDCGVATHSTFFNKPMCYGCMGDRIDHGY